MILLCFLGKFLSIARDKSNGEGSITALRILNTNKNTGKIGHLKNGIISFNMVENEEIKLNE